METENNCFEKYNANPKGKQVGDCTIRAISKILEEEWEKSYAEICLQGFIMCDMPSATMYGEHICEKKASKEGLLTMNVPIAIPSKIFVKITLQVGFSCQYPGML